MALFKKKKQEPDESTEARLISPDVEKQLVAFFKDMDSEVVLEVFTRQGENDPYNEYTVKFATELADLIPKITATAHDMDSEQAAKRGVTASPTVLVAPDACKIRFTGAPAGEEGKSFLQAILRASTGKSGLSDTSLDILKRLDGERNVRVFVSPTCPYCPGQVINGIQCAVEMPDRISIECVEMNENPELTAEYGVGSVPHTFFGDGHDALGLQPQERFVLELTTLEDAESYLERHQDKDAKAPAGEALEVDLIVAGAGPAGLTAGIYAERSGLSTVILEKGVVGGQVVLTPTVENYPGFPRVAGQRLMEVMQGHAREYTDIKEGEEVEEVKVGKRIEVVTARGLYAAKALLLATGVTWRKLGAPGEEKYFGAGVNYCATCDGYLYKGKRAAVVGGGNTALTDALHMKHLGVDVTVIHRRDAFRAEQHLQDAVEREGIPVLWNTEVAEILGTEGKVTALRLLGPDGEREEPFEALFVAVGHEPHVEIARQLGLALTKDGFIKVDQGMRTSIPRIYAAGDVTGGVRQIVTAVGEGSTAALSVFEDLANPYWNRK